MPSTDRAGIITPHASPTEIGGAVAAVNAALASREEYAFLFRELTERDIAVTQNAIPLYWALGWAAVVGCYLGLYGKAVMGALYTVCFARWAYGMHDAMHLSEALPRHYALCMPVTGFTPITCCYRDLSWEHRMKHHHLNKAALDHHDDDWDAKWSARPLLQTIALLFACPSQFSFFEVAHQWATCPSRHWGERLTLQLFMCAQMWVAHQMGLLLALLCAGHVASVVLFLLFHGLTHRESFYRVLLRDPSGLRHVPIVDDVLGALVLPGSWMDMKFHDVHHAFANSIGTLSMRCRVEPWRKVEAAAAAMVSEGLFVDAAGCPISHLKAAGHACNENTMKAM